MKTGLGWQRFFESDLRKRIASIPTPRAITKGLNRFDLENQRKSLVFFVFLRFSRFFKNRFFDEIHRFIFPFWGFQPESDWGN